MGSGHLEVELEAAGKQGGRRIGTGRVLIVMQCTLLWANHDVWGIESEERPGPCVTASAALPNC